MSSSGLALRKLTGCLQDAWSSVGCFGDEYHTVSEGTGGTRRLSDDLQSMYQLFFIDISEYTCIMLIFAKIKETQQKSMKANKYHYKSMKIGG